MDLIFFYASKFLWLLISPDHLLVMLLVVSLILFWFKFYTRAKLLLSVCVIIILIITFFPVGDWLLHPIENRFPIKKHLPDSLDGIIVLAGAENIYISKLWDQPEFTSAAERLFAFIHLIQKYPKARYVFTGGTGSVTLQEFKSESVVRQLFKEQGVDADKIEFESESKNTYENAVYTFKQIQPQKNEQWLLITSASHMPRSMGVFNQIGWDVIPYPVDHNVRKKMDFRLTFNFSGNLDMLKKSSKEWAGLVMYYLTGKTDHLFPSP